MTTLNAVAPAGLFVHVVTVHLCNASDRLFGGELRHSCTLPDHDRRVTDRSQSVSCEMGALASVKRSTVSDGARVRRRTRGQD